MKDLDKSDNDNSKRLDAIIRLLYEFLSLKDKNTYNLGFIVRLLQSVRLTPAEIASVLGKNSSTELSTYLYGKKKGKGK